MNVLDSFEEQERQAADDHKLVTSCATKVYSLISDGLRYIGGLDVAAGICGINAGDVRRSLDRDGRRLSVEHAMAIMTRMRRHNAAVATLIAGTVVFPVGLGVFPLVTMTADEKAKRYEAKLMAIGHAMGVGDALVEEALKTP